MAELTVPRLDFSALGDLPQVYRQAQDERLKREQADTRQRTLAELGQGTGALDYDAAARKLLAAGDREGAMSLATLGLRRSEAQRSQSNADRSYNLQEREIEAGKIPAGFERNPAGGLRPIVGGPSDPAYKRTVTDKQNAPAGYKWADPNNPDAGLVAIPGGPGEKIPAEVAARLGLAKSFLGQLPEIRKRVQAGEMTGLIDGAQGAFNIGGPGEIRRQISSGAEALLRNLTGAGMSIEEARKYVARYEPEFNDSSKTVLSKLDQLERELQSVSEVVTKGRGPDVLGVKPEAAPAQRPQPPVQGARQAPDGNFYVPDPQRPGKYLKVN